MVKITLLALPALVSLLLAGAVAARSIEATRAAQDDCRFIEAVRLGEALALGLLLPAKKKDRGKARDLLARAIEAPSKDACDRILHELAVEKLASLGGK